MRIRNPRFLCTHGAHPWAPLRKVLLLIFRKHRKWYFLYNKKFLLGLNKQSFYAIIHSYVGLFFWEDKSAHNETCDFYAHMALMNEHRFVWYFCRYSENIAQRYFLHNKKRKSVRAAYKPKVLQQLCGHANRKTTMDRYVHATDASPVMPCVSCSRLRRQLQKKA